MNANFFIGVYSRAFAVKSFVTYEQFHYYSAEQRQVSFSLRPSRLCGLTGASNIRVGRDDFVRY